MVNSGAAVTALTTMAWLLSGVGSGALLITSAICTVLVMVLTSTGMASAMTTEK